MKIQIFAASIVIILVGAIVGVGMASAYNHGADEVFTVPEYNLVCVYKGNSLSCVCPCGGIAPMETMPRVVTSTPNPSYDATPTSPVRPKPTPTDPTIPTPTPYNPTPEPNGIRIVHYDADGTQIWDKCMPVSAWNGHDSHAGHIIQDLNLGSCYR